MNLITLSLVALGGAAGSVIRALVGHALPSRFPWATLLVNVAGSCLIGWLMARFAAADADAARRSHALMVTGFCGGFTTFSAFSWQTFEQLQKVQWSAAALNVALSLALCVAAAALGFKLGKL